MSKVRSLVNLLSSALILNSFSPAHGQPQRDHLDFLINRYELRRFYLEDSVKYDERQKTITFPIHVVVDEKLVAESDSKDLEKYFRSIFSGVNFLFSLNHEINEFSKIKVQFNYLGILDTLKVSEDSCDYLETNLMLKMMKRLYPENTFVMYFSGHGLIDEDGRIDEKGRKNLLFKDYHKKAYGGAEKRESVSAIEFRYYSNPAESNYKTYLEIISTVVHELMHNLSASHYDGEKNIMNTYDFSSMAVSRETIESINIYILDNMKKFIRKKEKTPRTSLY